MTAAGRLVIVSNRLPSLQQPSDSGDAQSLPVGGLVSALSSALAHRKALWVGWSGEVSEKVASIRPAISDAGGVTLAALDLSRGEINQFYNNFCNRTLWPLLHSFPGKMAVSHEAYRAYLRANRHYAEAVAGMLDKDDVVWVHDYHLLALGSELRKLGWTGKTGFFLHTPFPPAELFAVLPWAPRILEMIMDFDLFGLHTRQYARNLYDALSAELPGAVIGDSFIYGERSLNIRVYPIGIDPAPFADPAFGSTATELGSFLKREGRRHHIVLGVDRLDYTKGIVQRLQTFEHLLEHYPALRGEISLVQISAPSRSRVPEYVEERQRVDELVGRINGRYSEGEWIPIRYLYRSFPQDELVGFYREADVCLITPLRYGMNLVAKEFVAAQLDDPGVLVLSKFCGAAEMMQDALIVNPYDIEGTAAAIYRALRMPKSARVRRRDALMQNINAFTAQAWSEAFLGDLEGV
ncbi:MAG: trehalose-6-phosphate synthase [SAR202 cluster bacterium]|nr:trehalose-6-phosphate synthase [SAR202 cluster bacterium]